MIWACIPKSTYVSFSQVQMSVFDVVAIFNIGRKADNFTFEKLNMILKVKTVWKVVEK